MTARAGPPPIWPCPRGVSRARDDAIRPVGYYPPFQPYRRLGPNRRLARFPFEPPQRRVAHPDRRHPRRSPRNVSRRLWPPRHQSCELDSPLAKAPNRKSLGDCNDQHGGSLFPVDKTKKKTAAPPHAKPAKSRPLKTFSEWRAAQRILLTIGSPPFTSDLWLIPRPAPGSRREPRRSGREKWAIHRPAL